MRIEGATIRNSRTGAQSSILDPRSFLWSLVLLALAGTQASAVRSAVTVRGTAYAADDGSLHGMRALLTSPRGSDTVALDSLGRFAFAQGVLAGDEVTITLAAADSEARYLRSVVRFVARDTTRDIRVVLLPSRWAVVEGTYAGAVEDVHLAAALARVDDGGSFYRVTRAWPGDQWHVVGWPESAFPIRVALRHRGASRAITAADSAAFWEILHTLERDLGERLFVPAPLTDSSAVVNQLTIEVAGALRSAGLTWVTWSNSGDIFDGSITVLSTRTLRDPGVITHELMHALGFGHTRSWNSVLHHPAHDEERATAQDAAYVQLLYRVRTRQRTLSAPFGMLEAVGAELAP
ncbi:MAG: hypothetical protein ABJD07_05695 [Gemmatimonadaceae bacterium]